MEEAEAEYRTAIEVSYAMGSLLVIQSVVFALDALARMRRDCFKARNNISSLRQMPSVLMIPKLVFVWVLFLIFRLGHEGMPVFPDVDTSVRNSTTGKFFMHSSTSADVSHQGPGQREKVMAACVFMVYGFSYTVITISIMLGDRLNMLVSALLSGGPFKIPH